MPERVRRTADRSPAGAPAARPRRSCRTRATCATCSRPTCRCAPCSARSPTSSSSTTKGCAAARAAPTRRCNPSSPARSASASWRRSNAPGQQVVASANPGCAYHLAAAGVQRQAPDGPRRRGAVSGGSVRRPGGSPAEPSSTISTRSPSISCARRPPSGRVGRADDKRLTQARRAVEKAIHLLRGELRRRRMS